MSMNDFVLYLKSIYLLKNPNVDKNDIINNRYLRIFKHDHSITLIGNNLKYNMIIACGFLFFFCLQIMFFFF